LILKVNTSYYSDGFLKDRIGSSVEPSFYEHIR